MSVRIYYGYCYAFVSGLKDVQLHRTKRDRNEPYVRPGRRRRRRIFAVRGCRGGSRLRAAALGDLFVEVKLLASGRSALRGPFDTRW